MYQTSATQLPPWLQALELGKNGIQSPQTLQAGTSPLFKSTAPADTGVIQTKEFGEGHRSPKNAEFFDNLMNEGEVPKQPVAPDSGEATKEALTNFAKDQAVKKGIEAGLSAGSGTSVGLGMTAGLGAGGVAAYYAPTYMKYGKKLKEGDLKSGTDKAKALALTNPMTAWAVPLADFAGIGGGKGKDQLGRDAVRKQLLSGGFIDDKYNVTLADGSKYDIGKDGSDQRYNVDFSKEGIGEVVGAVNPLAAILTGGNPKLRSDFAGYLTNAVTSSGDVNANVKALYEKAGVNRDSAFSAIDAMNISPEEKAAFKNGVNQIFGGGSTKQSVPKQTSKPQGKKKGKPRVNSEIETIIPQVTPSADPKATADELARAYLSIYANNSTPSGENKLLGNRLLK